MHLLIKRCALGTMIALAVMQATAGAAPLRQTGTIAFGTFVPASPTSLSESATYRNPDDPNGKPPAVRRIVVRYPAGFRIDTSVPGQCHASDQQLQTSGGGACPSDSRVGSGDTELATGFPGPAATFQLDLEVYKHRDQLIFLIKPKGSSTVLSVGRSKVDGRTITTDIPATPGGPPDGQSSVKHIAFALAKVTKRAHGSIRSFLTTPSLCPASNEWTSVAMFTYADGVSQTIRVATPCKRSARHPPSSRAKGTIEGRVFVFGEQADRNSRRRGGRARGILRRGPGVAPRPGGTSGGRFRFRVDPAHYAVTAQSSDAKCPSRSVRVRAGDTTRVKLRCRDR